MDGLIIAGYSFRISSKVISNDQYILVATLAHFEGNKVGAY